LKLWYNLNVALIVLSKNLFQYSLDFYGVELFPAKDHHGVELGLGITGLGLSVFKNRILITTFSW